MLWLPKTSNVLIPLTFLRQLSYGPGMRTIALPLLSTLLSPFQSRALLHPEILALRQQLAMVNQAPRKRPRYHLRDRDKIFGAIFRHRIRTLDMREVLIAPRSPWQNPYVERLIGSIRRECLNPAIVFNDRHLKKLVRADFKVVADPVVGGLHLEYGLLAKAA
ncbi:MAG: integrase core domain-containing protein [Gammaproteobacteria bacterium]